MKQEKIYSSLRTYGIFFSEDVWDVRILQMDQYAEIGENKTATLVKFQKILIPTLELVLKE